MEKDKDTLIFYKGWRDAVKGCSPELRLQIYEAAMSYAFDGEVPTELDGALSMAFTFMKQQIDRDAERYQTICERNRNNGKKGGRPKTKSVENNPENPLGFEKPKKPKKADNDNDNELLTTINCSMNNNNISSSSLNAHEEKINVSDIVDYVLSLAGTAQYEVLQRTIYRLENKMPDNVRMREVLGLFCETCITKGDTEHEKKSLFDHLISWCRIAIPAEAKLKPKQEQRSSHLRTDIGKVYTDF